jgi:hypothetical protein
MTSCLDWLNLTSCTVRTLLRSHFVSNFIIPFYFCFIQFSFFLSFFLFYPSLFSSSFCILSLFLYLLTLTEMIPSPDQQSLFKLKCEYLNVHFRAFCSYSLLTSYPTDELNLISSVIYKKLVEVPKGLQVQWPLV